jgi:hypothetical protein
MTAVKASPSRREGRHSLVTGTRPVNMRKSEFDVRIDRATKWGNPFRIGVHGTREEVVARYRVYISAPAQVHLRRAIKKELKGKRLGCWCAPLPCHGDILAELADE